MRTGAADPVTCMRETGRFGYLEINTKGFGRTSMNSRVFRRVFMHVVTQIAAGVAFGGAALSGAAHAEVIKPIKATQTEIAGTIFQRNEAVHDNKNGNATTDVVTFTSKDNAFQTGMYKSGPLHEVDNMPGGYPYNEFMYFISGSVTLTSADGSVMTVHAGEAVTLPRGWTGTFDTKGYTKMYVTYNPDDIKK
jgi:uncharacterized cupin superfamily protein